MPHWYNLCADPIEKGQRHRNPHRGLNQWCGEYIDLSSYKVIVLFFVRKNIQPLCRKSIKNQEKCWETKKYKQEKIYGNGNERLYRISFVHRFSKLAEINWTGWNHASKIAKVAYLRVVAFFKHTQLHGRDFIALDPHSKILISWSIYKKNPFKFLNRMHLYS